MSKFDQDLSNRQKAGVGGVIVITQDEVACLRQMRDDLKGDFKYWSTASGFTALLSGDHETEITVAKDKEPSVKGVLESELDRVRLQPPTTPQVRVFASMDNVLEQSGHARRLLLELVREARHEGMFVVLVSTSPEVHPELREIPVLDHPLPDFDQTMETMDAWAEQVEEVDGEKVQFAAGTPQSVAAQMLVGLTETQQLDALSLAQAASIERKDHRELPLSVIKEFKEAEVGKLGYLEVKTPTKKLSDLVGHADLKQWVIARRAAFDNPSFPAPKGIGLVGPPGTGKSRFVEGIAAEWGFPLLEFDMGAVFSKWLGESDAQLRRALDIASRMAPCVFFMDEADLSFGDDGGSDGVTKRILGKFQTWMANKEDPVFVVMTANYPQKLPAALTRKGRMNEIWAMDFPDEEERASVWDYYLKNDLSEEDKQELCRRTEEWSPAEIEAVVEEARLQAFSEGRALNAQDVQDQIAVTNPVAVSMKAEVNVMREWAKKFARPTTKKVLEEEDPHDYST